MVVGRGRPSASADVPTPSLPVFAGGGEPAAGDVGEVFRAQQEAPRGISHRVSPPRHSGGVPPLPPAAPAAGGGDGDAGEFVNLLTQFYSTSEKQRSESAQRARQYEQRQTQLAEMMKQFMDGQAPGAALGGVGVSTPPPPPTPPPPTIPQETRESERLAAKCHQLAAELVQAVKRNDTLEGQLRTSEATCAQLRDDLGRCREENARLRRELQGQGRPSPADPGLGFDAVTAPALVAAQAILIDAENTVRQMGGCQYPPAGDVQDAASWAARKPADSGRQSLPLPPSAPAAPAAQGHPHHARCSTASSYAPSSAADGGDQASQTASVVHLPAAKMADAPTTMLVAKTQQNAPAATRQASVSSSIFASCDGDAADDLPPLPPGDLPPAVCLSTLPLHAVPTNEAATSPFDGPLHAPPHSRKPSLHGSSVSTSLFAGATAGPRSSLSVHEVFTSQSQSQMAAATQAVQTLQVQDVDACSLPSTRHVSSLLPAAQQDSTFGMAADAEVVIPRVRSIHVVDSQLGMRQLAVLEELARAEVLIEAAAAWQARCVEAWERQLAAAVEARAREENLIERWVEEVEGMQKHPPAGDAPDAALKERILELENEVYELAAAKELAESTCEDARQRIAALEVSRDAWWQECSTILRQMADRRKEAAASLQELDVLRREVDELRSHNQLLETSVMASAGDPVDVQNSFLELQAELQLEAERRRAAEAQLQHALANTPVAHQLQLDFLSKELEAVRAAQQHTATEEKKRRLAAVRGGAGSPMAFPAAHADPHAHLAAEELQKERDRRMYLEEVVIELRDRAAAGSPQWRSPAREPGMASPPREHAMELLADEVTRERAAREAAEAELAKLRGAAGAAAATPPAPHRSPAAAAPGDFGDGLRKTPSAGGRSPERAPARAADTPDPAPAATAEGWQAKAAGLEQALAKAETELTLRKARLEELGVELRKAQMECASLRQAVDGAGERCRLLEDQKAALLNQLEETAVQLQEEKIERTRAAHERDRAAARVSASPMRVRCETEELHRALASLEEENRALQAMTSARLSQSQVERQLRTTVASQRDELKTLRDGAEASRAQLATAEEECTAHETQAAHLLQQLQASMRSLQEERIHRTKLEQDAALRRAPSASPRRGDAGTLERLRAEHHDACSENVRLAGLVGDLEGRLATAESLAAARKTQLAHYQASPDGGDAPPPASTKKAKRKPGLPKFGKAKDKRDPPPTPPQAAMSTSGAHSAPTGADARRPRGAMQLPRTSGKLKARSAHNPSTTSAIRSILGVTSPETEHLSEHRSEIVSVVSEEGVNPQMMLPASTRQLAKTQTYSSLSTARRQEKSFSPSPSPEKAGGQRGWSKLASAVRSKSARFLTSRQLLLDPGLEDSPQGKLGDMLDDVNVLDAESHASPPALQAVAATPSPPTAREQHAAREAARVAHQAIHGSPATLGPSVTGVHVRLNVSPAPETSPPRVESPPPASSPYLTPRRSSSLSPPFPPRQRNSIALSGASAQWEEERALMRAAVEEQVTDMLDDLRVREVELQQRESLVAEERRRMREQSIELRSMEHSLSHQAEALAKAETQAAEEMQRERSQISAQRTRMASLQSRRASASPVVSPPVPSGRRRVRKPPLQRSGSTSVKREPSGAASATSPSPRSPVDLLRQFIGERGKVEKGGMTSRELRRMLKKELQREPFVGSGASSSAPRPSQSPHTLATPEKTVALSEFLNEFVRSGGLSQRRRHSSGSESSSRSSASSSASSPVSSRSRSGSSSATRSSCTAVQDPRPSDVAVVVRQRGQGHRNLTASVHL